MIKAIVEVTTMGRDDDGKDTMKYVDVQVEAASLGDVLKKAASKAQAKFIEGVTNICFTVELVKPGVDPAPRDA